MKKLILAVSLLLAACAPITLVPPQRQTVGGVFSVEPTSAWNRMTNPQWESKVELWTLDGPVLNTLMFITGVADGEELFRPKQPVQDKEERLPVYRSTMTEIEIQELFQATASRNFQTPIVETKNLQPATLAGARGFRFETKMVARDEVERDGVAVGIVQGGKLYIIWFQGARLYHFHRYLPEFERIIASIRFLGA